jgi:hypothetical protein
MLGAGVPTALTVNLMLSPAQLVPLTPASRSNVKATIIVLVTASSFDDRLDIQSFLALAAKKNIRGMTDCPLIQSVIRMVRKSRIDPADDNFPSF